MLIYFDKDRFFIFLSKGYRWVDEISLVIFSLVIFYIEQMDQKQIIFIYYFIVLQCRIPCSVEFSMQKFQYKVVFLNLILFVRSICNHRDRIYSYKLPTTTYRQKKNPLKRNFDSYPYVFFTFVYFPIFFINSCTKPQQCDRHVSPRCIFYSYRF